MNGRAHPISVDPDTNHVFTSASIFPREAPRAASSILGWRHRQQAPETSSAVDVSVPRRSRAVADNCRVNLCFVVMAVSRSRIR